MPRRREGDHGPVDGGRDLGMAADQRDTGFGRRRGQVAQERERLRRRRAFGQQDGRDEPARLGAGGGDVVGVHEDGGAPHGLAAERDGVAVRDEEFGAVHVERRHVLAHGRRHDHRRVGAQLAEKPGQQVVGQLAGREREPQPDDVLEIGEAVDDEVAVGRARRGVVDVAAAAPSVDEVGGDRSGRSPGLHVEQVVADDERLLGQGPHRVGRVHHAVRRRLGRQSVVASHDDVEVGGSERGEAEQGAVDGDSPVARQHAGGDACRAEGADGVLDAVVGLRGVGGGQLEGLEGGCCGVSRRPCGELPDPFEYEAIWRTAHLALDGGEVERPGTRQRAVEVEEDGTQAKGPRAAAPRASRRVLTGRRP